MFMRSCQPLLPVLVFLLCPGIAQTEPVEEELDHQTSKKGKIALILSPGDREDVLDAVMSRWRAVGGRFPTVIALEPGPLDLAAGLRMLPNEIAPRVTLPDLLIISSLGKLEVDDGLLAVVRRCLLEDKAVWVVGPFPEALLDVALEPGWEIQRVALEQLEARLLAFTTP